MKEHLQNGNLIRSVLLLLQILVFPVLGWFFFKIDAQKDAINELKVEITKLSGMIVSREEFERLKEVAIKNDKEISLLKKGN